MKWKKYHMGQVGECKNFMWPTCILLCDIYLNIYQIKCYGLTNNKAKILLVSFLLN